MNEPTTTAAACEWCGRAVTRNAEGRWCAVKGDERGYDPLTCEASDDRRHCPDQPGSTPTTARSWPERASPTREQLAEWLIRCTDEERVTLCARMLDANERARRCFEMDHDGLQAEIDHLRRASDEAYRRGWNDAAKSALEAVANG